MNQDTFLCEYFHTHETVIVNAIELQKVLQEKNKLGIDLKRVTNKLEIANALLAASRKQLTVSLDVKC